MWWQSVPFTFPASFFSLYKIILLLSEKLSRRQFLALIACDSEGLHVVFGKGEHNQLIFQAPFMYLNECMNEEIRIVDIKRGKNFESREWIVPLWNLKMQWQIKWERKQQMSKTDLLWNPCFFDILKNLSSLMVL